MLHFPSPVKLTGWNTTGGLLGDQGWEAFFFPFSFPTPSLSHDSYSLPSILVPLCSYHVSSMFLWLWALDFCSTQFWCLIRLLLQSPHCKILQELCLESSDTNYIPPHGSNVIVCIFRSAAVAAFYLLSRRVAFLIFLLPPSPSHWLSPLFSLHRMLFCYFLYKKSCTGGPECTAQHKDFKWGE